MSLEQKLRTRTAHAAVIGMGYVGLPQAMTMAEAGFTVTGIDVDAKKVSALQAGRSYIEDVPATQLRRMRRSGHFSASTDFAGLAAADVITICVPTPLSKTKDPDVSYIRTATAAVAKHLRRGQLVILESTTYPGTTEEIVRPALEATGLRAGRDFFLAFSPERIDPGNVRFSVHNTPKIVGGLTPRCTKLAATFYGQFVEKVVPVSSPQAAEMAKLLENTFRNINIALVNELAMMCDVLGVDVYEVIDAAASKPFGFMPFYPGPGLGGHCIPVDPEYLAWKLKGHDFTARFIALAGEINTHMPQVVSAKVAEALNATGKSVKGAKVLVLGVAYKRDVADTRESPALTVISTLKGRGAKVSYHDPHVPTVTVGGTALASARLTPAMIASQDCVVILTDHKALDIPAIVRSAKVVVDTRNATRGLGRFRHKIVKLGAPSALLDTLRLKGEAA
ncbi:MAG: nucleotide sugar dehydrogenase [Candidatus Rokubacteria bacterium]|nr:nucleotide sugar dehydrogenase [Candidatus Rokubacteria bacterium]